MNFLIICTYFPPDTTIAAVRPYMFAKYLYEKGHHVTVLWSGEFHREPDPNSETLDNAIKIVPFLGNQCDAELYIRGEYVPKTRKKSKKLAIIPVSLRSKLTDVIDFITSKKRADYRIKQAEKRFQLQKDAIEQLFRDGESFDVVFSTYSELENVFAGEYAAKLFGAKWIMDFRDPVVAYHYPVKEYFWNKKVEGIQQYLLENADLCTTVSEGLTEQLSKQLPTAHLETLYNGYEPDKIEEKKRIVQTDKLTICYTGQLYGESVKALAVFLTCLRTLCLEAQLVNIRFVYAGPNSLTVRQMFQEHGLNAILEDYGYVSRAIAHQLQEAADIFLVLSWNTKRSQGIITGKFYEGIKADKPILAVLAGDVPNSELWKLNERYQYGFCYETSSNKVNYDLLLEFINRLYEEKMRTGMVSFLPRESIKNTFRYDKLAEKLIMMSEQLIVK